MGTGLPDELGGQTKDNWFGQKAKREEQPANRSPANEGQGYIQDSFRHWLQFHWLLATALCKNPIFNFFGQKVDMDKAKTRRVYYWVVRRLNQTGVLTWCLIGSMSVPGKAGPISNKIRDKVWKCKPNISTPNMEAPDWSGLASCWMAFLYLWWKTQRMPSDVKRNIFESTLTASQAKQEWFKHIVYIVPLAE